MTEQQKNFNDESRSALKKYIEYSYGKLTLKSILFESSSLLFSNLHGILGFGLRKIFYPYCFKECSKSIAFGKGITVRRAEQIVLGKGVLLDDYVTLDIRGAGSITIEDFVSIGRFTSIVAKDADIIIRKGTNISSNCRIATQSRIEIGESVLVGAFSYIGPGNHQKGKNINDLLIEQPMEIKDGVKIDNYAWIGAHTTIMDGAKIGERAIIGAHSLVKDSVGAGKTAVGVPAIVK